MFPRVSEAAFWKVEGKVHQNEYSCVRVLTIPIQSFIIVFSCFRAARVLLVPRCGDGLVVNESWTRIVQSEQVEPICLGRLARGRP